MIAVREVTFAYSAAVHFRFHLQIDRGQCVAITGENGAGKSTLLQLIAGFLKPVSGDILIDGQQVNAFLPHRREVAMLFKTHNCFAHLTVWQNIALGFDRSMKLSRVHREQMDLLLRRFSLFDLQQRTPLELSDGQVQRVALARCMAQDKSILLLDEPFSTLDPPARKEIVQLLFETAKEKQWTLLFVTHHLEEVQALVDDVIVIDRGRVA